MDTTYRTGWVGRGEEGGEPHPDFYSWRIVMHKDDIPEAGDEVVDVELYEPEGNGSEQFGRCWITFKSGKKIDAGYHRGEQQEAVMADNCKPNDS